MPTQSFSLGSEEIRFCYSSAYGKNFVGGGVDKICLNETDAQDDSFVTSYRESTGVQNHVQIFSVNGDQRF